MKILTIFLLITFSLNADRKEERFKRKVANNSVVHQKIGLYNGYSKIYFYSVQDKEFLSELKTITPLYEKDTSIQIERDSNLKKIIRKNFHIISRNGELTEFIVLAHESELKKVVAFLDKKKPTYLEYGHMYGNDFSSTELGKLIEKSLNIQSKTYDISIHVSDYFKNTNTMRLLSSPSKKSK